MSEKKRELARNLFEEGLSTEAVARRLEIADRKVRTWREEWRFCLTCGTKLRRPTGRCGFCVAEQDIAAGRMPEPGAWWEEAAA